MLLVAMLQLFGKSVADGMTLYQQHVSILSDCDAMVAFTHVNDIFDLLNGRRPVEGICLTAKRDRVKVFEGLFFCVVP